MQIAISVACFLRSFLIVFLKAGFHLNECNDSAEVARCGACVVGSIVDSPSVNNPLLRIQQLGPPRPNRSIRVSGKKGL